MVTPNARDVENQLRSGMPQILHAIRFGGVNSQAEAVKVTGLGRAAVADRVNRLAAAGLIESNGSVARGRGRPSRRLRMRGAAGHILVAALGASSADLAITDLVGHVYADETVDLAIADGPEAVLSRVEGLFDELCGRCQVDLGPLAGIGIAIPGPVEFQTGRPVAPPIMPGWDGYGISERFNTRYGARAWVDNDVNVLALGEWRHGIAGGHRNVVFVKIGTGIGAGIISDGMLHRGDQGAAGDVGHIQVTDDPTVACRCGNTGCLEALAGGYAIARQAERAAQDGRSQFLAAVLARRGVLTAADVTEAACHGDVSSTEILQRAGRLIGTMLAAVVNLLNPSLIVIGGGVAGAGDLLLAAVRESVYRRSLPLATRHLLVVPSTLGRRGGIAGTAAMVLDQLYSEPNLSLTLALADMSSGGADRWSGPGVSSRTGGGTAEPR